MAGLKPLSWDSHGDIMTVVKDELSKCLPKVVLELGTFAAKGTIDMAEHIEAVSPHHVQFYTLDGGEPVIWRQEKDEYELTKAGPGCEIHVGFSWDTVVKNRNERLQRKFSKCDITYIEGITTEILPNFLPTIDKWDFCFHDATHLPGLMMRDFDLLVPFSHIGSVIVFDDADVNFLREFPLHVKDAWEVRITQDTGKAPTEILTAVRVR